MSLEKFFRSESAPAILLILFAVLAMLLKNSALSDAYNHFLEMEIEVRAENFAIEKPLLLWVNDGLMAVFFFLVGLELKMEIFDGQLRNPANVVLPVAGAIGGFLVPAGIYLLLNYTNPVVANGWAIPTATDIAFTLGILALLGDRVPASLKLFLLTLAIVDDLFGIIVIAVFYTSKLSLATLSLASVGLDRHGNPQPQAHHPHRPLPALRAVRMGVFSQVRRPCHTGRCHQRLLHSHPYRT